MAKGQDHCRTRGLQAAGAAPPLGITDRPSCGGRIVGMGMKIAWFHDKWGALAIASQTRRGEMKAWRAVRE